MKKFRIYDYGRVIEVLTDDIYPPILGYFDKIEKIPVPNAPTVYKAYGKHLYDEVDLSKQTIVAYGYPNTKFAERGYAYYTQNDKIGKLDSLPNLLNKSIVEFQNYEEL